VSLREPGIHSARRDVVRLCEWIERILNRYANAGATYPKGVTRIREYVPRKCSRRRSAVPESAHVFEICEKLQILVANFAVERAV
jgi:hypothetical protein